jgi:hypothetical protein
VCRLECICYFWGSHLTVPDYFGNYSLVDCTIEIGRRRFIESGIRVGVVYGYEDVVDRVQGATDFVQSKVE